jgi:prepilin-type N-terminal cleavage/methylation domain-containing protein
MLRPQGPIPHPPFHIPHSPFRPRLSPFRPTAYSLQPTDSPSSGLTLIEMLVAMAITLVMMAAVVTLFANISASIRNRRSMIELGGQLRQVRQRLALDLAGATCDAKTWQQPGENRGYIEIIEGQWSDADPSELTNGISSASDPELDYTTSLVPSGGDPLMVTTLSGVKNARLIGGSEVTNGGALGDWDDILALTIRSESEPFVAQVLNPVTAQKETVSSPLAEVYWYALENKPGISAPDEPGMRKVFRALFLVLPNSGPWIDPNGNAPPDNVSVHYDKASGRWIANTLGDLSKREYRYLHRYDTTAFANGYPHAMRGVLNPSPTEWLVLNDALAFDVRVFEPGAPLYQHTTGTVLQPGDPGWLAEAAKPTPVISGYGAYCDLGWDWNSVTNSWAYHPTTLAAGIPTPLFNEPRPAGWHLRYSVSNPPSYAYPAVFDTWSFHYENDGIDQDNGQTDLLSTATPNFRSVIDQGTNGLDDDNINGVDDPGERETSPPYDTPLRGIQVKLRVYERDARQIRETSVTHSFVE